MNDNLYEYNFYVDDNRVTDNNADEENNYQESVVVKKPKTVLGFERQIRLMLFSLIFLFLGFLAGIFISFLIPEASKSMPMIYSGIPDLSENFFSWFSTYLINMLISVTIFFLCGIAVFGRALAPILLLIKGATIGISVMLFFREDIIIGIAKCAFIYAPVIAVFVPVLLWAATKAMQLSKNIAGILFRPNNGDTISLSDYIAGFLKALVLLVLIALFGALLTLLYSIFIL